MRLEKFPVYSLGIEEEEKMKGNFAENQSYTNLTQPYLREAGHCGSVLGSGDSVQGFETAKCFLFIFVFFLSFFLSPLCALSHKTGCLVFVMGRQKRGITEKSYQRHL